MIELTNVTKRFRQVLAVDDLSMSVPDGKIYGFLGPNGAGKTTTIKMIAGTLKPTAGRITIGGFDIASQPERAKRILGFIPDRPFLYEKLTGLEFLRFKAELYHLNHGGLEKRATELLDMFELAEWKNELVESYSHGMKQRLIMGAALLHRPRVLVVDEPMVGLDPKGARLVKNIFRALGRAGVSVLMSTHTLSVAAELCDRVGIIFKGRLLAEGSAGEIMDLASGSAHLEEAFLRLTGGHEEQSLAVFLGQAE